MILPRRALLLAPCLVASPAFADGMRLEVVGEGVAALTGPGVRRPLLLPARGARLLPDLECGGARLTVAAFADVAAGAVLEWAVLAVALDDRVALLALEPLAWRGANGGRMATRLSARGDRQGLLCQRDSAIPAEPTLWKREAWTDHLRWAPPCGLEDAPVRVPLAGTRQQAVALWRRRAAGLVALDPAAITAEGLAGAGLQAASFSLAVSATPSMRQPSGRRIMV